MSDALEGKLTDWQLGRLHMHFDSIKEGIKAGTLSYDQANTRLVRLHEELTKEQIPTWSEWQHVVLGRPFKKVSGMRRCEQKEGRCTIDSRPEPEYGEAATAVQFDLHPNKVTVDLVRVSKTQLGFKDSATYEMLCMRAQKLGLGLCPFEVGVQLILQYAGGLEHESALIGTRPFRNHGNTPTVMLAELGDTPASNKLMLRNYDNEQSFPAGQFDFMVFLRHALWS